MKPNQTPYWSLLLWILLWQGASLLMGEGIFFPSPITVITRLSLLLREPAFLERVAHSTGRILLGLILGVIFGILLAILSHRYRLFQSFLYPLYTLTTAVPVVSIIILLLIFFPARVLSTVISFSMVWPLVYSNVGKSLNLVNRELLEMAEVFQIPLGAKIKGIYLPEILPSLDATLEVAGGLGWKSGMAAEVIGLPALSIGEKLYEAKIYLLTADLFAWTLIVLLLSLLTRKIMHQLLMQLHKIR